MNQETMYILCAKFRTLEDDTYYGLFVTYYDSDSIFGEIIMKFKGNRYNTRFAPDGKNPVFNGYGLNNSGLPILRL